MPTFIKTLTPNGLQPVAYTADSLAEAAQFEPTDGIYTVTNTYNTTQVLKLDAHLDRMEDSARRENLPLTLDRPTVRAALRQMIAEANYGSVRFRITVPRQHPDQFILSLEPFHPPPPEAYANGVRCITAPGSARRNPAAKTADWMQSRKQITIPPGVYEALLLNAAGDILEGFSSNFYAIIGDTLHTAASGVLPGIAQQIVMAVAPALVSVERSAVNVRDLARLNEAFITSSSRGIVPVVQIDDQRIGTGAPGTHTLALRQAYLAWVQAHLEEL